MARRAGNQAPRLVGGISRRIGIGLVLGADSAISIAIVGHGNTWFRSKWLIYG
jgi:hypothetical protein